MVQDDMFHDGQPQPGSAALARTGLVHTIKALEDPGQVLRSDAWAEIAHKKLYSLSLLPRANYDFLSALSITHRVADQFAEDLVHGVGARDPPPIARLLDRELHVSCPGAFLHRRSRFRYQMAGRLWAQVQLFFS